MRINSVNCTINSCAKFVFWKFERWPISHLSHIFFMRNCHSLCLDSMFVKFRRRSENAATIKKQGSLVDSMDQLRNQEVVRQTLNHFAFQAHNLIQGVGLDVLIYKTGYNFHSFILQLILVFSYYFGDFHGERTSADLSWLSPVSSAENDSSWKLIEKWN